jgi:hypothetical protein
MDREPASCGLFFVCCVVQLVVANKKGWICGETDLFARG